MACGRAADGTLPLDLPALDRPSPKRSIIIIAHPTLEELPAHDDQREWNTHHLCYWPTTRPHTMDDHDTASISGPACDTTGAARGHYGVIRLRIQSPQERNP